MLSARQLWVIRYNIQRDSIRCVSFFKIFDQILTKFLNKAGALKGTPVLFKITLVQKVLQISHTTQHFSNFFVVKILTKFLKKVGALKGTPTLLFAKIQKGKEENKLFVPYLAK